MHNLEISQNRHRHQQSQGQQLQRQYNQFLESLWFSEIKLRMNDVSSSHPDTFEWMFDHTTERPWNSFTAWLGANNRIYWVHGKPGSGKTTLMKFLANDTRTKDLLGQRSPNQKIIIATFYFWLSGSKLQRSLRGFLCSLLYQFMLENRSLFDLLCVDKTILTKRGMHDWSEPELRKLLVQSLDLLTGPICIFVDGLDEFDQDDDVDNLINLIETLSSLNEVKICVSSRPEKHIAKRLSKYSQVRLQDLTAADIELFIRDSLNGARTSCSPTAVNEKRLDSIVEVMTEKADGVFLWVHYALSSLIRGMRNEDDFEDLLDRIEQLPSGMSQLYSQMWNRLNEDQQRYRDEAAIYFSYDSFYPLSVFELLVALDSTLQSSYLDDLKLQDAAPLAKQCQRLTARIVSRCAGLLEIVPYKGSDRSAGSTSGHNRADDSNSGKNPLATGHSTDEELKSEDTLAFHHKSHVKYLHRTAREFLLGTIDGKAIIGEPVDSLELRFRDVVRARISAGIQRLTRFDDVWVIQIISSIGAFESDYETEMLLILKRACEHLSEPLWNINNRRFWAFHEDFECVAAHCGCMEYIRHIVLHDNLYISPYYRGLLLFSAALGLQGESENNRARILALISWLSSAGADILTDHIHEDLVVNPAAVTLSTICHPAIRDTPSLARQAAQLLQHLLPAMNNSKGKCDLWLRPDNNWQVDYKSTCLNGLMRIIHSVQAVMTITKLFFFTARYFKDHMASDPQRSHLILDEKDVTKVVSLQISEPTKRSCPSSKDSVYLGEALDEILFWDETSPSSLAEIREVFEARLVEVRKRSPRRDYFTWMHENDWRVDSSRLTARTLDPSEDVDGSNWMERGHFKERNEYLDHQMTDSGADD
ncbi:MAG: hypothetical protein Q9211_001345 [Gyalolechia sp. 1 TL-2023]